jgi:hypothetical protein
MMFKVETSALEEYSAAGPGRDAGLRAVTVSDCPIRTGERGAL